MVLQVWWWYLHRLRRYRKKTRGEGARNSPPPSVGRELSLSSSSCRRHSHFSKWIRNEFTLLLEKVPSFALYSMFSITHCDIKKVAYVRAFYVCLITKSMPLITVLPKWYEVYRRKVSTADPGLAAWPGGPSRGAASRGAQRRPLSRDVTAGHPPASARSLPRRAEGGITGHCTRPAQRAQCANDAGPLYTSAAGACACCFQA